MSFWSAVGPIVGGLFGAGGNIISQNSANSANNVQSQRQMDFQEHMSNTAYQRAMGDMRAAGLNPMLAYSQGGASSPGGSQAHMEAPNIGAPIQGAIGSAIDAVRLKKEIESTESQIQLQKAQSLATVAQANQADASAAATRASMPSVEGKSLSARAQAEADIAEARARAKRGGYDEAFGDYDAVSKRILEGIGGVSDAAQLGRIIQLLRKGGGSGRYRPGGSPPANPGTQEVFR